MKNCVICNNVDGKYKCPNCLVYYCSVNCCKKHNESKCEVSQLLVRSDDDKCNIAITETKKGIPNVVTSDTITEEKLKLLAESDKLKNLLTNPHLRNLLKAVDMRFDPEKIIQKVMLEPIFVEFADTCLQIVEPVDRNENQ